MSAAHPLDALEYLTFALDSNAASTKDQMVREAVRVLIESCELSEFAAAKIVTARRACADSKAAEEQVISQENRALVIIDKVSHPEPFLSEKGRNAYEDMRERCRPALLANADRESANG